MPLTRMWSPVLMIWVAFLPRVTVPTTEGMSYSRAQMAAWASMPPESVTTALILLNSGVQAGVVNGATRMSSGWTSLKPS